MSLTTLLGSFLAFGSFAVPLNEGFYQVNAVGLSPSQNWDAQIEQVELDIDLSDVFAYQFVLGRSLNKWRVEAGYSIHSSSWESVKATASGSEVEAQIKGEMNVQTFLVSSFYDFENKSKFTPYIGGGLGLAQLSSPEVTTSLDDFSETKDIYAMAPSGQLIAGTSYELSPDIDVFLEGGLLQIVPINGLSSKDFSIDPLRFAGVKIGTRWRF